jgi:hypothetical protein
MSVARNKGAVDHVFCLRNQAPHSEENQMLALFLDHPPMFVAGEIALVVSLALFIRASVAAIADRASEVHQSREARHFRQ